MCRRARFIVLFAALVALGGCAGTAESNVATQPLPKAELAAGDAALAEQAIALPGRQSPLAPMTIEPRPQPDTDVNGGGVAEPPTSEPAPFEPPMAEPAPAAAPAAAGTDDWSRLVVAMSAGSINPDLLPPAVPVGVSNDVPPAPPLPLDAVETATAEVAQFGAAPNAADAAAAAEVAPAVAAEGVPSPAVQPTNTAVPTREATATAPPTIEATSVSAADSAVPSTPPVAVPTATPPAIVPDEVTPQQRDPAAAAPVVIEVPLHEVRGRAALDRIAYHPSRIGYTISFHPARSNHRGLTFTERKHIEIYVRPSMSNAELLYVIAHELGHAVDVTFTSLDDRARWFELRGIPAGTPWWPTGIGNDLGTPAGDFAECFASWIVGSPSHSAYGSCSGTAALLAEMSSR